MAHTVSGNVRRCLAKWEGERDRLRALAFGRQESGYVRLGAVILLERRERALYWLKRRAGVAS